MKLYNGDALEILKGLPSDSVDSLVTDPPAGIGFLGQAWDKANSRAEWVASMADVMKEIKRVLKPGAPGLVWSIPRTSHWTGLALENAGFEIKDTVAHIFGSGFPKHKNHLKPCHETWWLVRKPGKHTPLNIEESRIDGRWPGNLVLSHDEECSEECVDDCAVKALDKSSGKLKSGNGLGRTTSFFGRDKKTYVAKEYTHSREGYASRFFYCAKVTQKDKSLGLEEENPHPTVKSTKLMTYLIKLITIEGGTVLDPFLGSGSTGVAAIRSGFDFIGIEKDPIYFDIACKRINHERKEKDEH